MSKIQIRRAKISDIPSLVDKVQKFYTFLKDRGARDIAHDESVLRGGIVIQIGTGFSDPNWFCTVAVKDQEVIAYMIGSLEYCAPTAEYHKCVKIHAMHNDQGNTDSLVGGKVLLGLWGMMETWAKECGASYFYANIHPGNQPSVRSAKIIGFKHQYTQFYRSVEVENKIGES
jgi:hypothetical protein